MVYKWSGYSYKINAQIVGEEIEKIEQKKGSFTPRDIVKTAQAEKNPLHPLFEWDDKKAADAHRLQTARQILCCLIKVEKDQKPVRAFVNIETKAPTKQGLFANIRTAMETAETREIVLQNALAELMAFKSKYASLIELSSVFEAIEKLNK